MRRTSVLNDDSISAPTARRARDSASEESMTMPIDCEVIIDARFIHTRKIERPASSAIVRSQRVRASNAGAGRKAGESGALR